MRNEASWKILHFKHKNLRLINECCTGDSLPIHGLRYLEVQQGYSPTIESEMIVIPMTLPMIFLSCQRSNFSTPRWASWQLVSEITKEVCSSGSRPTSKGEARFFVTCSTGSGIKSASGIHCQNLASAPSEQIFPFTENKMNWWLN